MGLTLSISPSREAIFQAQSDVITICSKFMEVLEVTNASNATNDLKRIDRDISNLLHKLEANIYLPKANEPMNSWEQKQIFEILEDFTRQCNSHKYSLRKLVDLLMEAKPVFASIASSNFANENEVKSSNDLMEKMLVIISKTQNIYEKYLMDASLSTEMIHMRLHSMHRILVKLAQIEIENATIHWIFESKDKLSRQIDDLLCREIARQTFSGTQIESARSYLQQIFSIHEKSALTWQRISQVNGDLCHIDGYLATAKDALSTEVDRQVRLVQVLYSTHSLESSRLLTCFEHTNEISTEVVVNDSAVGSGQQPLKGSEKKRRRSSGARKTQSEKKKATTTPTSSTADADPNTSSITGTGRDLITDIIASDSDVVRSSGSEVESSDGESSESSSVYKTALGTVAQPVGVETRRRRSSHGRSVFGQSAIRNTIQGHNY